MSLLPGTKAPGFQAICFENGGFSELGSKDLVGSWTVLFFYPMDFGHVAASEILELEKVRKNLHHLGCRIVCVSRDSVVVHEQFERQLRSHGGVHGISFPLLEDLSADISSNYGMLKEEDGYTFRGYYILNPDGIVRARVAADLPVGLYIPEILRQVELLVQRENKELDDHHVLENVIEPLNNSAGILVSDSVYYAKYILCGENYPIYSTGFKQSPIDIAVSSTEKDEEIYPLKFSYANPWKEAAILKLKILPTRVVNKGIGWEIPITDVSQFHVFDGPFGTSEYKLFKVHAHWGTSEHSVDGKLYTGELHFLHYNIRYKDQMDAFNHKGGYAVVAIFLQENNETFNHELEKIAEVLPMIRERGKETETSTPVDLDKLLPESKDYFTYSGSLTQPDYREIVTWVVLMNPINISSSALAAMKTMSYGSLQDRLVINTVRPRCEKGTRVVSRFIQGDTS